MTITALPTPPSRSAPSTFSARMDAFLAALPAFVSEANALAVALNLASTTATSTTSLAIGTGSKSLTVDAGKSYQVGMSVKIAYDSSNWMHGEVTSYDSGTGALVVNVTAISGSGTYSDWAVTLSGPMQGDAMPGGVHELTDGATIAIDWANGATQYVTIEATGRTVTASNPVEGQVYRFKVIQGTGGSKTITTWFTVNWANDAPELPTEEDAYTIVTLLYENGAYSGDYLNFPAPA